MLQDLVVLVHIPTHGQKKWNYYWDRVILCVTPIDSFATYCVTLSEQCGSHYTIMCKCYCSQHSINPNVTPDITAACIPGTFTFTNNSSNSSEIQSFNMFSPMEML